MSSNKISFDERVKPKNVLALNEKVAAIRRYESDPVYKSVGRYFNCSPDQIKRIIKQKNEILAEWNNRTRKSVMPTSHAIKSVKMSFLGKAVHEWIRRMMYYTDFNLTDALIQTMAIEFKKVLGLQSFFPDKVWIGNFRISYNLKDVNTKTLNIGYSESHSVQIRDILLHLQDVCGPNGATQAKTTPVTTSIKDKGASTSISMEIADCKLKEEPIDNDEEITDKVNPCKPSCSTAVTSLVSVPEPVIPIIACVKTEAEEGDLHPKEEPLELQKGIINNYVQAINCVKMLEDFALLKENFRLIGLIERLEEALKESQ